MTTETPGGQIPPATPPGRPARTIGRPAASSAEEPPIADMFFKLFDVQALVPIDLPDVVPPGDPAAPVVPFDQMEGLLYARRLSLVELYALQRERPDQELLDQSTEESDLAFLEWQCRVLTYTVGDYEGNPVFGEEHVNRLMNMRNYPLVEDLFNQTYGRKTAKLYGYPSPTSGKDDGEGNESSD